METGKMTETEEEILKDTEIFNQTLFQGQQTVKNELN